MLEKQTQEARSNYIKQRNKCKATLRKKRRKFTNNKLIRMEENLRNKELRNFYQEAKWTGKSKRQQPQVCKTNTLMKY